MSKYHQTFETYLKKEGSRYTAQKKEIVDAIGKTKTHFEIDSFLADMTVINKRFSRATVYRTIKQLFEAGLIQKIRTKDGKVFYEQNFIKKHHDHMICNQCGQIIEIKDNKIETFVAEYCKHIEFEQDYRSLHIYGTCKNCKKKR